jgi:hypothetical protein
MARQTSILKFKGALGGLSFYEHKHYGMLVRKSNPVSAERMRTDPAFTRTRENSSEFGRTSKNAKLLRHALRGFLHDIGTTFLDNRTMQHMLSIKNKDLVNPRGQRCPAQALAQNPALLGGFELHATQILGKYLEQLPAINPTAGKLTWTAMSIKTKPPKATHMQLTAFRGRLDFENGTHDLRTSEGLTIPLNSHGERIELQIEQPRGDSGTELWGIKVVFLQEINGQRYPLQIGAAQLIQSNAIATVTTRLIQQLTATIPSPSKPTSFRRQGKNQQGKHKIINSYKSKLQESG